MISIHTQLATWYSKPRTHVSYLTTYVVRELHH
jgi:hypothetical protein